MISSRYFQIEKMLPSIKIIVSEVTFLFISELGICRCNDSILSNSTPVNISLILVWFLMVVFSLVLFELCDNGMPGAPASPGRFSGGAQPAGWKPIFSIRTFSSTQHLLETECQFFYPCRLVTLPKVPRKSFLNLIRDNMQWNLQLGAHICCHIHHL